jgi:hypothetical protein
MHGIFVMSEGSSNLYETSVALAKLLMQVEQELVESNPAIARAVLPAICFLILYCIGDL